MLRDLSIVPYGDFDPSVSTATRLTPSYLIPTNRGAEAVILKGSDKANARLAAGCG